MLRAATFLTLVWLAAFAALLHLVGRMFATLGV